MPEEKTPLTASRMHRSDGEPFEGDLFERRAIGDRLTELVERLPEGGVIAINAGWGEGKSWFARNWHADLKARGFTTVYLDAFEADYVEDAFLLITAELLTVLAKEQASAATNLREGARKVASIVLPVMTKATVRAISLGLTGIDLSKGLDTAVDGGIESVGDQAGELISAAIRTRIEELQARRKSVDGFRKALADEVGALQKPLVFLVDELDRCKPPFAVQLLERIKHFFSVPGVVFVLFLNREQLEASVRGLYGSDIDSNTYLSKFLTLSLTLPVRLSEESRKSEFARRYCEELGRRLGYVGQPGFDDFSISLSDLAPLFGMSFREIERAFTYYGLVRKNQISASLVAYLCVIRLCKPDLFRALVQGAAVSVNKRLYDVLGEIRPPDKNQCPWILRVVRAAHSAIIRGPDALAEDEKSDLAEFQQAFRSHRDLPGVFSYWARQLDLQIP